MMACSGDEGNGMRTRTKWSVGEGRCGGGRERKRRLTERVKPDRMEMRGVEKIIG